jgi:hypothetical protein
MQSYKKDILILGFDTETCSDIYRSLKEKVTTISRDDNQYDFFPGTEISLANLFGDIDCEAFQFKAKHKFSNRDMEVKVYNLPIESIPMLPTNFILSDQRSSTILFCFPFSYISYGFTPFDHASKETESILKYQLNDFMDRVNGAVLLNVLWLESAPLDEKYELLLQANSVNGKYLDGRRLAYFNNQSDKDLGLYFYFLQLPTLVVTNNYFPLKVIA